MESRLRRVLKNMNIPIEHILAKNEGWGQLIILAVVFGFAILKKIVSTIKDYSEQQKSSDSSPYEEEPQHKPSYHATHTYDKNAFKTIEQIRAEKAAAIRARYGIPEPHRIQEAPMELEPEQVATLPAQPISERMFSPPPVRREPPPVYVPKKKTPRHVESVQHPAYAQNQATARPVTQVKHPHKKESNSDMLISLSSPQDLRAAILYQEILGKPLALRD